jgi:hypothetical protein
VSYVDKIEPEKLLNIVLAELDKEVANASIISGDKAIGFVLGLRYASTLLEYDLESLIGAHIRYAIKQKL